jgi:hypothetical protein
MKKSMIAAVLAFALAPTLAFTIEPLQPGYKVGDWLELWFREYLVTGPGVDKPREGHYLACTYSTRPVVMVYTRAINAPVVRLIKKLDQATATHKKERLGSYTVLLCDPLDREKELTALAEKEKIQHTHLAMAVPHQRFQARFGVEAETTVILATGKRQVKASHAYRKGEMTNEDVDRILAELTKIIPSKDSASRTKRCRCNDECQAPS